MFPAYDVELTLREKSDFIPRSLQEFNEKFPLKTFIVNIPEKEYKIPILKRTDTEGYYCRKRCAATMILEIESEEKVSLEDALYKKISYFLNRNKPLIYNEKLFISNEDSLIIESLFVAYENIYNKRNNLNSLD